MLDKLYDDSWRDEPIWKYLLSTVLFSNPPRLNQLRMPFMQAFSGKRLEGLQITIEKITNERLDALIPKGEFEFLSEFAYPVSIGMICELMGVPNEQTGKLADLVNKLLLVFETRPLSREDLDNCNASLAALTEMIERIVADRKREPRADLISSVLTLESEEGGGLSHYDLVCNIVAIFAAGFETTANSLANSLLALFRHPAELDQVRNNPKITVEIVNELLRYDIPGQFTSREALEDVVIGDVLIREGETVVAGIGSANRDPEVFPDPDKLDLSRSVDSNLLSFGGGMHFCLGAQLARLEFQVVFETLLKRVPSMTVDIASAKFRPSLSVRGLEFLNCRVGPITEARPV